MFLNSLKDNQKELFLQLAIKATESNGIVPIEQKNMLKAFAIEMNIDPVYKTERESEDIIDELFGISTEKDLKIVLFEILGIIVSDSIFDEEEKIFVTHMVKKCKLDIILIDKMVKLLDDYANIYRNIVETVL